MDNHKNRDKNIKELLSQEGTSDLELNSFSEIKPTKNNWLTYILISVISLILAFYLSYYFNTLKGIEIVGSKFLEIDIAFIAVVFSAYALFQAMISSEFLLVLSDLPQNILKNTNKSFLNLILLYLYDILVTLAILIFVDLVGEDFLLFSNVDFDNAICFVLIFFYLVYSLMTILEIKCFAVNLYRMFNIYNASKILDDEKKKDQKNGKK